MSEGWRPIESAPKDGRAILSYGKEPTPLDECAVIAWSPRDGEWYSPLSDQEVVGITHWMPLPPPPATTECLNTPPRSQERAALDIAVKALRGLAAAKKAPLGLDSLSFACAVGGIEEALNAATVLVPDIGETP